MNPSTTEPPLPEDRFFNRELSWLEFNQRVLDHAADTRQPLLERAKFLAIVSSNLDEFFMVRVGGLKLQAAQNAGIRDPSGMTVSEQLLAIADRCHRMQADQYRILSGDLLPALADTNKPPARCSKTSAPRCPLMRSIPAVRCRCCKACSCTCVSG